MKRKERSETGVEDQEEQRDEESNKARRTESRIEIETTKVLELEKDKSGQKMEKFKMIWTTLLMGNG